MPEVLANHKVCYIVAKPCQDSLLQTKIHFQGAKLTVTFMNCASAPSEFKEIMFKLVSFLNQRNFLKIKETFQKFHCVQKDL